MFSSDISIPFDLYFSILLAIFELLIFFLCLSDTPPKLGLFSPFIFSLCSWHHSSLLGLGSPILLADCCALVASV
ncbi:hypothetical protein MT325_m462L [Paramecium bursaria chlorella virus MT325]|uniref:Uncharacterized protein m462L n=1 Tax=Paramecium bursaria Chlorella virus MT325 TaxID=346932 RepID=A7IUJ2_PBCVM|nr:hypothetical protein MT325_m462L [Paramecium bursaria chlorella virus MT325]